MGPTAVHPVSCGNRPQWVESGLSAVPEAQPNCPMSATGIYGLNRPQAGRRGVGMKGKAREPRGATISGGPLMENEVRERKIKRLLDARACGKEKYGVVIQHEKEGVIVGKLVEIGENNDPSYIQHDMVTLKIIPADAAHDLNDLADSLGLSFEEAAARRTAGRTEDTQLRRARG